MTLLATGIIGIYSLMASNNEIFEQNSVRGQLLIAANGILDDIGMRHVAGVSGSSLTSLTPNDWSSFLSENGIEESDVVLSFTDLSDLATYQISLPPQAALWSSPVPLRGLFCRKRVTCFRSTAANISVMLKRFLGPPAI